MGSNAQGVYLLLAVGAVLAIVLLPILRRRRATRYPPPGTFDDRAGDARGQLEQLLAEIQDLSREHIARLDTKIRMLNQLLLECDQKKKELEALLSAPRPAAPAAAPRPSNPLHDEVYTLKDAGKDVNDICSATGLEKGEVELILGLRRMPPGRA